MVRERRDEGWPYVWRHQSRTEVERVGHLWQHGAEEEVQAEAVRHLQRLAAPQALPARQALGHLQQGRQASGAPPYDHA